MTFNGAKLALFIGDRLLVIERDAYPHIPYPGHWDFPGGGREGEETPETCALRETEEEVGLVVQEVDLVWRQSYERRNGVVWIFVAHLSAARERDIRLGDEGQSWALVRPEWYIGHELAVPHFAEYLQSYLTRPAKAGGIG
ncbi:MULTISPECIES: NUDIX hydrolase [unclassified Phaeobacter]|uniref:NUDIX hydrolase n=1 Tax=unclassified Phaeobacter TaxID=2621772 RepID=UPI003A855E7B